MSARRCTAQNCRRRRLAGTIAAKGGGPTKRAETLALTIRATLEDAIAAGGSSLRDFSNADGELGYFQHSFRVYDREDEPCQTPGCRGVVQADRADGTLDVLLPGVPEVRMKMSSPRHSGLVPELISSTHA